MRVLKALLHNNTSVPPIEGQGTWEHLMMYSVNDFLTPLETLRFRKSDTPVETTADSWDNSKQPQVFVSSFIHCANSALLQVMARRGSKR
jgi:hypothetical protein